MQNLKYAGFHPCLNDDKLERIDPYSISPSEFYSRFILTRTPCVLTGLLPDSEFILRDFFLSSPSQSSRRNKNKIRKKSEIVDYTEGSSSFLSNLLENIEEFGKSIVKVEQKSGNSLRFGTGGKKLKMSVSDLLDGLLDPSVDGNWYMTTQYADSGSEDEEISNTKDKETMEKLKMFLPEPIPSISAFIPFVPSLLSHLVPQHINMWIGKSKDSENGTSSGLHHDYHDNLYILLQGRKRFTLFSPRDASYMYTYGNIRTVHPNGLIVYEEESKGEDENGEIYNGEPSFVHAGDTKTKDIDQKKFNKECYIRSDGADIAVVAKWKFLRARLRLETYREMIENEGIMQKGKAKSLIEDLENEVYSAYQTLLDHLGEDELKSLNEDEREESESEESENEGEFMDESDEYDSLGEEETDKMEEILSGQVVLDHFQEIALVEEEMEENQIFEESDQEDESDESGEIDWNGKDDYEEMESDNNEREEKEREPPSFSMIEIDTLYEYLKQKGFSSYETSSPASEPYYVKYPLLKYATPISVELNAGEMLYLPASWFHEVSSFSNYPPSCSSELDGKKRRKEKKGKHVEGDMYLPFHVALNYWFHPPSATNVGDPVYEDDYWKSEFENMLENLLNSDDEDMEDEEERGKVETVVHITEDINQKKHEKRRKK